MQRSCATSMVSVMRPFYKWRSKGGGMGVSEVKRLKALEEGYKKLKKLLAEQIPDVATLNEMLGKTV